MIKLSILVCAATLSTCAMADTADILNANNQVGIQALSEYVNYTENSNGQTLDTEKGPVPAYGIHASLMQNLWLGNDYIAMDYTHASGSTNYTGSYNGSSSGYGSVTGTSGATIDDFTFRAGKGFAMAGNVMLTPFLELGRHDWARQPGQNAGAYSFSETYTHNYYGIGGMAQYTPIRKWVLSVDALIGETFGSNINANLPPPIGISYNADLGNSALYKIGIGVDYAFTRQFHANIGLDYASWNYGQSTPDQNGTYEPNSQTAITTAKIGIGYAF